jgi:quercetin dioxygenase-like cupin family protein
MMAAPSWPRVLLRSEDSDRHLSVIETAPATGVSPPLHSHDFDETFYVLEGELIFQLRDEYFTVGAGQLAFAPRGVPHTYANLSGAPAHQLVICTLPASSATSRAWQPNGRAPSHRSGRGSLFPRSPPWAHQLTPTQRPTSRNVGQRASVGLLR